MAGVWPEMTCARIGAGVIAGIHERALRKLGVVTVAVLEADPARHEQVRAAGLTPLSDYEQIAALRPSFWDICTPTESHAEVFEQVCAVDPDANVVVEKPLCDHADLGRFTEVLRRHRGKVVVNENYCSSAVSDSVCAKVAELGLRPAKVIVEMSKHRGTDFLAGRFVDPALGAFGYEGTHLLAAVAALDPGFTTGTLADADLSPLDLDGRAGPVNLDDQGGAFAAWETADGCRVEIYTSMAGILGYPCPPYAPAVTVLGRGDTTRWRIFRVDGTDPAGTAWQVVGFYEPLPGLPRGHGALACFREWRQAEPARIVADDTMTRHFTRVLSHFAGDAANPCPPSAAAATIERLNELAEDARRLELPGDPDDVLGDPVSAKIRAVECARFIPWEPRL